MAGNQNDPTWAAAYFGEAQEPAWAQAFFAPTETKVAGAIRAQYDVGGNGRRVKGWNAPTSGPNRATQGADKVRDRMRDSQRNDWAAAAGTRRWTTNLIGTGIIPRAKRITDEVKKKLVNDLWTAWCKVSDADCVLDFYGQQTLTTRSWLGDGEVFARLRYRRPTSNMDVPLQVQLIEADFCPRQLNVDNWPGMVFNNRIRQGIEMNPSGQRVAYWFFREHPNDFFTQTVDITKLIRVPADQVLHIFEPLRPGQLRGVPDFAPVMARLRNIADFDDAVLERQKLANLFTAFLKKPMPTFPDATTDPLSGQPIEYDEDDSPMAGLGPGTMQELLPGEDVTFANPPEAGTTYSDYIRTQHLGTAAGQNLPYELLTGDILNVSDRTLRIIIQEFRRFCEQRQHQIIIPMFCQKVRDAWVDTAVIAGEIPSDLSDDAKFVEWQPQGWAYIHPVQDAQGKQIEVDAGFRSRDSVISERGDDPTEVDLERKAAQDRAKALGLLPPPPAPGQAFGNPAQDPNKAKP